MSDAQRARMLAATVQTVAEVGYEGLTVSSVVSRAGVSRRTFYELFNDREDCFMEVFDRAVDRIAAVVVPAYERQRDWRMGVREGLRALLEVLDADRGTGMLCVVEALGAGPLALRHRARVLAVFRDVVDRGRAECKQGQQPPALTAEGVVGAVFAVIHARLSERDRRPLTELLGPLMGVIVLPYLGPATAARELTLSARTIAKGKALPPQPPENPLRGLNMRLTYRTLRVLTEISARPGASNREVAADAGITDQGQISRLLTRLEGLGLIQNSGPGQSRGERNAWELTPRGQQVALTVEAGHTSPR